MRIGQRGTRGFALLLSLGFCVSALGQATGGGKPSSPSTSANPATAAPAATPTAPARPAAPTTAAPTAPTNQASDSTSVTVPNAINNNARNRAAAGVSDTPTRPDCSKLKGVEKGECERRDTVRDDLPAGVTSSQSKPATTPPK